MIGQTISHYKILEKIGQGGMGVVYRAEDTHLSREVAIKVLPEQFTQDPQRLARFEREAKLLASLNHPNIAAIYGLEEADGVRFIALELVEGETLAERVAKGPVPVEETLELCRQIAEGVEAAHEKGVIHRDLKPANVKVTPEGKVKILDFGLAKAFEGEAPAADISQSPTLTEEMTRAGVILGTAAYMSPEQAKGKSVDKRADIFAFGCVLYELLTGKRAFAGETITETLAAIIHKEPDWAALPPGTPMIIRFFLEHGLRKESHDRLREIADVRIGIEQALRGDPNEVFETGTAITPFRWHQAISWSLTGLLVIAIFLLWNFRSGDISVEQTSVRRFNLEFPVRIGFGVVANPLLVMSPDGLHLVIAGVSEEGMTGVYHRPMNQLEAVPLAGVRNAGRVFFSSDSKWVGFVSGGEVRKASLTGGAPSTICAAPAAMRGATWTTDGQIIFGDLNSGLSRVPAAGGIPEPLTTLDQGSNERGHIWPQILPGDKAVLFTVWTGNSYNESRIVVLSLDSGERKTLLEGGSTALYSSSGHLIFRRGTGLMAVSFDPDELEIIGEPVPVLEGIRGSGPGGGPSFSLSNAGTLAFLPDSGPAPVIYASSAGSSLVWVDRDGSEILVTQEKRSFGVPRISPDGSRVALVIFEDLTHLNLWLYELETDSFSRFTFQGTLNGAQSWSPDGQSIVFQSNPDTQRNLYVQPIDRSLPPKRLTTSPNTHMSTSWSSDGQAVAFWESGENDVVVLPLDGEGPQPFVASPNNWECCGVFSHDSQWLAYVSDEEGKLHVYVRPYPGPGGQWRISEEEGGGEPVWSPNGEELFYRIGDKMMAVSIQTEPTFIAGRPQVLFVGSYVRSTVSAGYQYYDISPDGNRFLMLRQGEERTQVNQVEVILNWTEELKRLAPAN
jgi:serine/threonine-protein kinase